LTVALKSCVALMGMIPLTGDSADTVIAGTVTVAEPALVGSVTEVAVTVTVRLFGESAGAV